MMLSRVLRDIFDANGAGRNADEAKPDVATTDAPGPSVLNVGGGSKSIAIPPHYKGFRHLLLDIDPLGGPDIVHDARNLTTLDPAQFDAVYCSHNLEHYYKHDGRKVLAGFLHVLKADGFAEIRVPDLKLVMKRVIANDMDVEDILYMSARGPISVCDVLYGYGKEIEESGQDFYAHKTGFSALSLASALREAGFGWIRVTERTEMFEVHALAFKDAPDARHKALLGIA